MATSEALQREACRPVAGHGSVAGQSSRADAHADADARVSPLRRLAAALALLAIALATLLWSPPAWGEVSDPVLLQRGARLFDNHCAGCHLNGGNVIRHSKTLRRRDLLRQGIISAADVARIAAAGKGQMSGYEGVLGEGGADAVAAWVWSQAEQGWPRG